MSTSTITHLVEQVSQRGLSAVDEAGKQGLLSAARALVSALEDPIERVARLSFHDSTLFMAVRMSLGLDLFRKLLENDYSPKTPAQLAKATGGDEALLERFLKHLATGGIVSETGPDEYQANEVTKALASDEGAGMIVNCYDALIKVQAKLPEFFEKTKYKNPTDKDDKEASPWKWCTGMDQSYFQWLFAPGNEFQANAFNNHMRLKTMGPRWHDIVPVKDLLSGTTESGVLLVDIGGNTGEDLLGFHRAHPDLPGRLIVQDLPGAFETVAAGQVKPVELMPHDFFKPQPVEGAKGYFMKMILHDWPDAQCREILANIKPALKPGYSKIFINEIVVPATRSDWFSTGVDMLMLMAHASQERSEKHWKELIESVGLKITKIWIAPGVPEKVIEVELP